MLEALRNRQSQRQKDIVNGTKEEFEQNKGRYLELEQLLGEITAIIKKKEGKDDTPIQEIEDPASY